MNITNRINLLPFDGEAYFLPDLFEKNTASKIFGSLTHSIPWKQEPVKIMGRDILQPRLTAWYGDEGKSYSYTGITMQPLPWNDDLLMIKEKLQTVCGHAFNSALLNLYRDGNDSVGWHRDNEISLGLNPVIASVSFGEARKFRFKHYRNKSAGAEIMLRPGSLLLMSGETQHNWLHSIQKNPNISRPRINITFRFIR